MKRWLQLAAGCLGLVSTMAWAADAQKLCLDGVCIGDDLLKLSASWAPLTIESASRQYYANEVKQRSIKDIYKSANIKLVSDDSTLVSLMPYLIEQQRFDGTAIEALKKVQGFCLPMTIKGELKTGSNDKVYVTAQAIPPTADGMQLRVVGIEKVFDIFHPISRPDQEGKVKEMRKTLKKQFPGLIEIRNIDDMFINDQYTDKPVILGFKFSANVAVPMAIKLRDVSDIPTLDEQSMPAVCKI